MTPSSTDLRERIAGEITNFIQNQARAISITAIERLVADLPALRKRFARIPAQTYPYLADQLQFLLSCSRTWPFETTSNVCAILGLRSLYFLLAGVVHKFVYLKPALAIILSFIGAKMLLADVYHIPTAASLGVVGLVYWPQSVCLYS
jgi:hypothetical protein